MKINFEHNKRNNNILKMKLAYVIKEFCKLLGIQEIEDVVVLNKDKIQGLQGTITYDIINDLPHYTLKLDETMITEEQFAHKKSVLYNIIHHELSHIQNIENLSKNIDIRDIPDQIIDYANIEDMYYNIGCILWGEFYAYLQQFKRDSTPLDETILISDASNLSSSIIVCYNGIQNKSIKAISFLNKDIYLELYSLCTILAYNAAVPYFNYYDLLTKINKKLHCNCNEYMGMLENTFQDILCKYPNNVNKTTLIQLGSKLLKFYELLQIKILFEGNMILDYDETQPIISWYNVSDQ